MVPIPKLTCCMWKSKFLHLISSCPTSLSVKWKLHLPVPVKPWISIKKLHKSSKKIVLQVELVWTDQVSWYKRNTLFGRQEIALLSLCLPDVPLLLHPGADLSVSSHGMTLSQVRCHISLDLVCLRFIPLLCTPSSHLCLCLVIAFSLLFYTWCDLLPSTVTDITWEIKTLNYCTWETHFLGKQFCFK